MGKRHDIRSFMAQVVGGLVVTVVGGVIVYHVTTDDGPDRTPPKEQVASTVGTPSSSVPSDAVRAPTTGLTTAVPTAPLAVATPGTPAEGLAGASTTLTVSDNMIIDLDRVADGGSGRASTSGGQDFEFYVNAGRLYTRDKTWPGTDVRVVEASSVTRQACEESGRAPGSVVFLNRLNFRSDVLCVSTSEGRWAAMRLASPLQVDGRGAAELSFDLAFL